MKHRAKTMFPLLLSAVLLTSASACQNTAPASNTPVTEPKTAASVSSAPESKAASSAPESSAAAPAEASAKTSTLVVPAASDTSEEETIPDGKRGIDPFRGLKVDFTGTAPFLEPVLNTQGCTEEVKSRVTFTTEPQDHLRNGDTVKIQAELFGYSEDGDLFLTNDEWEYTVSDQREYCTSVKGLDLSSIHKDMEDKVAAETVASKGDGSFGGCGLEDYYDSVLSKTVKESYLLVRKKRYEDEYEPYNRYIRLYDYLIKEEDGSSEHIYIAVSCENVSKGEDGVPTYEETLEYNSDNRYDDLVGSVVTAEREYYDVEKL